MTKNNQRQETLRVVNLKIHLFLSPDIKAGSFEVETKIRRQWMRMKTLLILRY